MTSAAHTTNLQLEKIVKEKKLNTDTNNSFGIKSIIHFIIDKYKQILLLLLVVLIILVVDHITYYNNLFYSMPSVIPGASTNTFKKKLRKNKK